MRKLIAVLASLLLAVYPAQAQKTKANLITEVNTNFPDNTTGLITPAILRATVTDMINSWYGLVDATNSGTGQITASGYALATVPAASVLTNNGTYVALQSTDASQSTLWGTTANDPRIRSFIAGLDSMDLSGGSGALTQLTVGKTTTNIINLSANLTGGGASIGIAAGAVDANPFLNIQGKGTGSINIVPGNGAAAEFFSNTSAVNFLQVTGTQTANSPIIAAAGSDTNISVVIQGKGTNPALFLAQNGVISGAMQFAGLTSGVVTIQPQAAAGTYNFNLPTTAGTANQVLTSQGGGSTAMTWQNVATGNPVQTVTKQVFTASGTYTPHAGMIDAIIECVGGGGGGGGTTGAAGQNNFGGGGASGSYSRSTVTAATIGASKTVTIGTAGSGGAAGNNSGTGGGASCVTSTSCVSGQIVSANGGGAGTFGMTGAPASGGAAGTGDVAAAGNPGGQPASAVTTAFNPIVGGASSYFGGGAPPPTFVSGGAINGIAAGAYGSGGSGGWSQNTASSSAGGNGSAGICVITEFNNQ